MDILAHGLWTGAAAKAINLKLKKSPNQKPLKTSWAVFWGIFPDLFAFTIPFVFVVGELLTGAIHWSDLPHPGQIEPAAADHFPLSRLAHSLYNISHSLFVFSAVFLLVWILFKKPIWELGGWLLHVLIDIPTHSYQFYPTPLFWPVSQWKFLYGTSWVDGWFIIINYSAIVLVYIFVRRAERRAKSNTTR